MILLTTTYKSKGSNPALRIICCESCRNEFIFELTLSASSESWHAYDLGSHNVHKDLQNDIQAQLEWQARNRVVPVPCPVCGHYQSDMIPVVRERGFPLDDTPQYLKIGAFLSLPVGLFTLGFGLTLPDWPHPAQILLGVAFLVAGVWMFFAARARERRRLHDKENYDPNDAIPVEVRKKRGRRQAGLVAEFERRFGRIDRPESFGGKPFRAGVTIFVSAPVEGWPP